VNTVLLVPDRQRRLRQGVERDWAGRDDTITVVIGVSNRVDDKLANTIKSVREQTHPASLISIIVVDYNNTSENSTRIAAFCDRFGASHVRVCDGKRWNKSRCYNIVIRRATSKFLMSCDADILLAPNYLATAIDSLRQSPLSVVYSQCLDLPQEASTEVLSWHVGGRVEDINRFLCLASPRSSGGMNQGISVSYTCYYRYVHGYDEFYEEWGCEDTDLQNRFLWLGLDLVSIKDKTFYLHQWHEKHASLDQDLVRLALERNELYLRKSRSVVRNGEEWGEPGMSVELSPCGGM